MRKALHMETTQVAASKTCAEIINELVSAGARQIATDYDGAGSVTGLRWIFQVNGQPALFAMPSRVDPIYKILIKRRRNTWLSDKEKARTREQSERVAWRQLLRWVQAQVAMIETGMVEPGEVFSAFLLDGQNSDGQNRTLWERLTETRFKALPAASEVTK